MINTTILFTGGGSAGHVVPNIALITALKDTKVAYMGAKDGVEKNLIKPMGVPYYGIACGKLRRYWSLKNFIDPFKILLGILQAWYYMGKIKPDVVFSKGGFVAFPVVVAAWLRRIPVLAHESDLTPGLANRLSFPFIQCIALTFSQTQRYLPKDKKTVVTGTPIRDVVLRGNAQKGRAYCGFSNDKPCLLILGGGSGSSKINNAVYQALPRLLETFQVIHGCGEGKKDPRFDTLTGYKAFEYLNETLPDIYACTDLMISRAGANTVCEILILRKPAVLIPLSAKASRGDQIENAGVMCTEGLADVLQEDDLTTETLIHAVQTAWEKREVTIQKITDYAMSSGTQAILQLIKETIKK